MGSVCVYRGFGPTDAYLVRDWLERNGVRSEVRGESLMGLQGQLPIPVTWPTLWVLDSEHARAAALVQEFEGPSLVHPTWVCAACEEENGPTFASCWSCGADRPDLARLP